jgi:hypothetical protein
MAIRQPDQQVALEMKIQTFGREFGLIIAQSPTA